MAEIQLGSEFDFLRHIITIHSIGRVTVLIGRGVVVGIGTSSQGPALTPTGLTRASQIDRVFGSGKLADGGKSALDQGADAFYGVRVLGENYATASLALDDSQVVAGDVGTLDAIGPGVAGNIPTFKFENGDIDHTVEEIFPGTGQESAYLLLMDDLVESATNRVLVGESARVIVYTGDPDPGEAKLNKVTGELSFAATEWPTTSQQIRVRYKHHTRKLTIQPASGLPIVFNNLSSLTMINAKLKNNAIAEFTPDISATHLPKNMVATPMAGGSDGDEITVDDWSAAFNAVYDWMSENIIPSSIFATESSVTQGEQDVVALMDGFLWRMADKKRPLQGFISLPTTWDAEEMADFRQGYTNMWMTLISNGKSRTERDLAPARAGQEAALPLGTSAATETNSLKGVDDLLFQWDEVDRETLTYAGVEVLVKDNGIHPYVGVTTDTDDNLRRTVDVRTYANCIIFMDKIIHRFLNERRTLTNLGRLQNSLHLMLDKLLRSSVLDDFSVTCGASASDHNGVDIDTMIQAVGHMERFYHDFSVGYWSDNVAA